MTTSQCSRVGRVILNAQLSAFELRRVRDNVPDLQTEARYDWDLSPGIFLSFAHLEFWSFPA